MEHIRELLHSRIADIRDPVQKVLLQDVLMDVFDELLTYSEERYAQLEQKLDAQLHDPFCQYYIYTGLCRRSGLDAASRCLFEVKTDGNRREGYLGTIFLACAYPDVCRCLSETHQAQVETDQGTYMTTVLFQYCSAYLEKIAWLYQQFRANQVQWHTVNCPFLYKLLDIVDKEGIIPEDAVIQKVEIAMGELSRHVVNDVVLVWNICEEIYKTSAEAAAAGKAFVYEHQIPSADDGVGYLAAPEGEDLFTVVRTHDGLSVRTEQKAHEEINLIKIIPLNMEKDHTQLLYPLQTNHRTMRHVDRQALLQPRYLWTRGETVRMLSAYEVFQDFELADIRLDMTGEAAADRENDLDVNPFIKTHSLLKQKRSITLVLHPKDNTDIFLYEKMFFLLGELQLCTEEYEWTGVLR